MKKRNLHLYLTWRSSSFYLLWKKHRRRLGDRTMTNIYHLKILKWNKGNNFFPIFCCRQGSLETQIAILMQDQVKLTLFIKKKKYVLEWKFNRFFLLYQWSKKKKKTTKVHFQNHPPFFFPPQIWEQGKITLKKSLMNFFTHMGKLMQVISSEVCPEVGGLSLVFYWCNSFLTDLLDTSEEILLCFIWLISGI